MSNSISRLRNKKRRAKENDVDVLLAMDAEATNAQEWIVEGCGNDEVEPGTGLTWQLVDEAIGANVILQPRRSSRVTQERELHEDDFISEDEEEVENVDVEFESD
ncbi:hypothetical protein ACOSQ4_013971 [Xanthoceras sorbifolium]